MAASDKYEEETLWGLGALANIILWFEELLNTVNGIALMIGAGIAVTDLLTDGALSHASMLFVFAWAVSQAVGIEVQLLGSFARARTASRNVKYGAMVGWLILGFILLVVTVIAGYVYSVVRADNGISTEAALAQLGISNFAFLGIRAILAAGLVALSGWTRYIGRPKVIRSADEEVAAIELQMKIADAKARLNRQKAKNAVRLAKSTIAATFEDRENEDGDEDPKSGAGISGEPEDVPAIPGKDKGKRIYSIGEARRLRKTRENGSVQAVVYAFLDKHPNAPLSQIMEATGVSKSSASKYKKSYRERVG